ncbi:M23 family metallopeptidase [Microbacterium hominis]|uniref:M23 family metallopeptidase n=1 Tax=Microbacterium hominis TaxID=162426 RepID=UPI001964583D|nr:M23 family metallopeptidase [Microbacterium hominis]QRY40242.1 M23 family metallopeptidase [Microbacterium hominis]
MTLDTPTADAAPSRRASRRPEAAATPNGSGVLTRAEYRRRAAEAAAASAPDVVSPESVVPSMVEAAVVDAALTEAPVDDLTDEPSLAEAVVADVAAAIVAETVVGAQPDEASRRRLRRAARAVFESVAADGAAEVEVHVDARLSDVHVDPADGQPVAAQPIPVAEQLPSGSAFTAPADDACDLDEFEFAARLFSFTGETPVQRPVIDATDDTVSAAEPAPHVAPRRPRATAVVKRMAAASFSVGVMAVVGLLAVGTTTPAAAIASASDTTTSTSTSTAVTASQKLTTGSGSQIQAFVASGAEQPNALDRPESYNVTSMAELAAESGVRLFANTWVNDPTSPIQYPFPVGVPISAAFGSLAYESEFATPHNGVDLTPGEGAEIHAVAAGTVRIATEAGGDYGVTVLIDHIIDGQLVSTRYGHMQYGSLQVKQGDKVTAGQVIGRVGQTGKATGPHLHLEVLLGGTTRIDPMPWLAEHTKGGHTVG